MPLSLQTLWTFTLRRPSSGPCLRRGATPSRIPAGPMARCVELIERRGDQQARSMSLPSARGVPNVLRSKARRCPSEPRGQSLPSAAVGSRRFAYRGRPFAVCERLLCPRRIDGSLPDGGIPVAVLVAMNAEHGHVESNHNPSDATSGPAIGGNGARRKDFAL